MTTAATIPENEARTPTYGVVYRKGSVSSSTPVYLDCSDYIGQALEISAYGGPLFFALVPTNATSVNTGDTTLGFEENACLRVEPGETKVRVPQTGRAFLWLQSASTSPLADVRVGVSSDLVT